MNFGIGFFPHWMRILFQKQLIILSYDSRITWKYIRNNAELLLRV